MSFTVAAVVGAGVGVAKFFGARGREKKAAEAAKKAKAEMKKRKAAYEALDTSNLAKDMVNMKEDLTINQKGMELQNQQGQQQRANIMQQMAGAAGGSGIAALAQTMANQGQLAAQKSAEMIGDQEAANQKAMTDEASKIQTAKIAGAEKSRAATEKKTATLLGMSQQELASANAAKQQASSDKWSAVGDIATSFIKPA